MRAAPWIAGAALILWLGSVVANEQWDALAASSPWLFFIALWIAFLKYGTGYIGTRAWEKRHPMGQREIAVELSEGGFRTRSYPGELQLRWEGMLQVVETDEFLLFYSGPVLAHYLPKVAIPATVLAGIRALLVQAKGKDFRSVLAVTRPTAG
jgi:hypothetical protein